MVFCGTPGTRDYRRYSAIADLQTSQFTVPHALGFSVFTSRILATDLQQSHRHFKSHMKSSLHSLIPFLHYSAAANSQDSTQFNCKLISRQSGVSKLNSTPLCCSVEFFFVTTLHKHRLSLFLIVLGVFTAPLHNNGLGADHVENSLLLRRVYLVVA
jgi:hypothetical protein